MYERYRRSLVDNWVVSSLLEIIDFISTVETSNANCAWTAARNLPLSVSTLDYNSLALDVRTDMAVHMAQATPNTKNKEYKNTGTETKVDERGRSPKKYDKYSAEKRDKRSFSKDRNSSRRTASARSSSGPS